MKQGAEYQDTPTAALSASPMRETQFQMTSQTLADMDALGADSFLPSIIGALFSTEDAVALQAEALLASHPLFCLRKGPWPAPDHSGPLQKTYFSEDQIRRMALTIRRGIATAAGPLRKRIVESAVRLNGLENVVDVKTLGLSGDERDYYEQLTLCRSLSQFKRQMTIVLSYACNKRCSYCFADGIARRLTHPISRADFVRAVEWGQRAGVSRLPVTGGEPTLHPEFPGFLAELRGRNLTTSFSPNGCVPRTRFECLSNELVEAVTFHILDDEEYAAGEGELLEENIRCARDKGIVLIFRYVLSRAGKRPWPRLFDLAARYRPAMLTFSPVFPGPYRREMSREVRAMFQAREDILLLARTAAGMRIRPVIAKPIPLCMFTREEFLELAGIAALNVCDIYQNGYTNNSVVNPDLSLYPCMALPLTGAHLNSTPSLDCFGGCSRRAVEPLQRMAMLEECPACQLHRMRLCQPACLSFALPQS